MIKRKNDSYEKIILHNSLGLNFSVMGEALATLLPHLDMNDSLLSTVLFHHVVIVQSLSRVQL